MAVGSYLFYILKIYIETKEFTYKSSFTSIAARFVFLTCSFILKLNIGRRIEMDIDDMIFSSNKVNPSDR